MNKPILKPERPYFSSGPCSKYKGWNISLLSEFLEGRSHRSELGKQQLGQIISLSKELLEIPDDYVLGIVPSSDTGALELALWNLLGTKSVDVFAWESFSQDWKNDIVNHLKIKNANLYEAPYGEIADLSKADMNNDIVFVYNGTTSGVCVPNLDWIADDRTGLTICDATSGIFSYKIDVSKLDVVTWSWQKVMGGEGGHGMIALSPRAIQRLENNEPVRPLPKIFRLTKNGKLIKGIFEGSTINTPSMLAVADHLLGLQWAKQIGGLSALIEKTEKNFSVLDNWVKNRAWIDFLATDKKFRSKTSVCFKVVDENFNKLEPQKQKEKISQLTSILTENNVAYDINSYPAAPIGIRIWAGATVEENDIKVLTTWIDWAWNEIN